MSVLLVLLSLLAIDAEQPCGHGAMIPAYFVMVGRNVPPPNMGLPPLRYAEDDVLSMREAAIKRMCFLPENITVLTGDMATPEKLLARLDELRQMEKVSRLFVYVSAHGDRESGILLKRSISFGALREKVKAVHATQTMLFLDTCASVDQARAQVAKGPSRVELQAQMENGFFSLSAAVGTAFERAELHGSEITSRFLAAVSQSTSLDSLGLCALLKNPDWTGECETRTSVRGVVIVPAGRAVGHLQVEGEGAWRYDLFREGGVSFGGGTSHTGFRLEATVPDDSVRAEPRDAMRPGRFYLRRSYPNHAQCSRSYPFSILADQLHVVEPTDWTPDPDFCDYLRHGSAIPSRIGLGLLGALGVGSGWVPGAGLESHLRLGLSWAPRTRGARYRLLARVAWSRADEANPQPVNVHDLAFIGAVDPIYAQIYTVGFFSGLEMGVSYAKASRAGSTGLLALRAGALLRHHATWQPELSARLGVRVYETYTEGQLSTVPWFGVALGATYGLGL